MASLIGGEPVLAGTTWTEVVAAPAAGKQRQVLSALAKNPDTVQHTYLLRKLKGATPYELTEAVVGPGMSGQLVSQCVVLDAIDESLQVKYETAATVTESFVDVAAFEV